MKTPDHRLPEGGSESVESGQLHDGAVSIKRVRFPMLAGLALAGGVALHAPEAKGSAAVVDTSASYDIGLTFVAGEIPYKIRYCTDDTGAELYSFISWDNSSMSGTLY